LDKHLMGQAQRCVEALRGAQWRLVTAESCTGGMIAAAVTEIAGSSEVFDRGYVTYSNQSKVDLLGVPETLLDEHGAVSDEVCRAMAAGAIERGDAQIAVSVTGIAGPGGESPGKPIGLVYIGMAIGGRPVDATCHLFDGDRYAVRRATVVEVLDRITRAAHAR
jgi:nicotinamide-nucleotide amidase